jgi:hypothetical protein
LPHDYPWKGHDRLIAESHQSLLADFHPVAAVHVRLHADAEHYKLLLCAVLPADKPKKCSKKAKSGDKVSVHYTGLHLLHHPIKPK